MSWLWRAYCIGEGTRNSKIKHQDGCIGAILMLCVFVTLGMTLSLAHWVTIKQSVAVEKNHVVIVLSIYLVLACVAFSGFFCRPHDWSRNRAPMYWRSRDTRTRSIKLICMTHISVVGIFVFCLVSLVMDFSTIVAEGQCLSMFQQCGQLAVTAGNILFTILCILFKVLFLLFVFRFQGKVFRQTRWVRYGLAIILLALLCIWFEYTLYHVIVALYEIPNIFPCSGTNYTEDFNYMCFARNTSAYHFHYMVIHKWYPVNIGFCVLSAKLVLTMFFETINPEEDEEEERSLLLESLPRNSFNLIERRPEIPRIDSHLSLILPCLAIIGCLIFLTCAILETFNVIQDAYTVLCLLISMLILMLCASHKGFHVIDISFRSDPKSFSVYDMLVVISMLGGLMNRWLTLYAVVGCVKGTSQIDDDFSCIQRNNTEPGHMKVIGASSKLGIPFALVDIFQFVHQSGFMLLAQRVKIDLRSHNAKLNLTWLLQCLLCLALSNLTLWLYDMFILSSNQEVNIFQSYYYNDPLPWTLLMHITMPCFLFFRFNSALVCLRTYLKHKNMHDDNPTPYNGYSDL